mmetsp:Transcript_18964/g.21429  ORF Transcript_18964/g.21429 Transcript_18964/m.21429 type:complete len:119 (+) Transcript_18964:72-428(+)
MKSIIIASLMVASATAFAPTAIQQQASTALSAKASSSAPLSVENTPIESTLHPTWFPSSTIMCDGKPLGIVGSTRKELQVDMWLANHPFYNKNSISIDSEGRVERFMKKYGLQEASEE